MSTGSRTPNTETGERRSSRASSTAPPHKRDISSVVTPSEASLQQSSTSQSPNVEAGTFILPDPLPSSARAVTSPVTVGSWCATPTDSTCGVVEDEIATELCGTPRLKRVRDAKTAPSDAKNTAKGGKSHFLPLLKDEPSYPRQPGIVKKLSNISKQPTDTQSLATENAAHPNANSNPQESTLLCVKQHHREPPTMSK
jgi:hypothetical protein